jgi:hypothetical protein
MMIWDGSNAVKRQQTYTFQFHMLPYLLTLKNIHLQTIYASILSVKKLPRKNRILYYSSKRFDQCTIFAKKK